jgi:oxygen-independent coproporphyrinogen-3 oxidase
MLFGMAAMSPTAAGIYVHIPFCARKCAYCDFYSVSDLTLKPEFLKALSAEIASTDPGPLVFDTIYIGGGTPSLLDPAEVEGILKGLASKFRFKEPVEVSLEANPGTVDAEKLRGFRSAGVNRLNIGVQSFREKNLKMLGRIHSARQAHEALSAARRSGFDSVGLDLMYGLPGQTQSDWRADLERALAFRPEHVACYMLSVEPGTPLAADQRQGHFQPAPEGEVAELFLATSEFLAGRGFRHYEVSNFARCEAGGCQTAHVSRHNSKYWARAPYLGFGPAAHSFLPPRRFWNHRDVKRYGDDARAGRRPVAGEEALTAEQQMMEAIMLGLRTAAGIDLRDFKRRFGVDFMKMHGKSAVDFQSRGLLTLDDGRCAPTRRGMLYLNAVTAALV